MPFSDLYTEERMKEQDPRRYHLEKAIQQWQDLFMQVPTDTPTIGPRTEQRPIIRGYQLHPKTQGSRMPQPTPEQLNMRKFREWWPWLMLQGGPA